MISQRLVWLQEATCSCEMNLMTTHLLVSTSSVFITDAIAASEQRHVATVDISGAYLNAPTPMGENEVHIRLDKLV